MKKNIHPQYFNDAVVNCTCGNRFTVGSTKQNIFVEVCHQCHPYYTGKQHFIDTKGKIHAFEKKRKIAEEYQKNIKPKKTTKNKEFKTKSLKDLLSEVQ